jgi:hypothetical protein
MVPALATTYAMVGLTQLLHISVVTHKECTTGLAIVFVLTALGYIAFVDTLVVVQQYGWDVKTIGTWHTILAIVAWDGGILLYKLGRIKEVFHLFLAQWL